jgi:hypothetical protein
MLWHSLARNRELRGHVQDVSARPRIAPAIGSSARRSVGVGRSGGRVAEGLSGGACTGTARAVRSGAAMREADPAQPPHLGPVLLHAEPCCHGGPFHPRVEGRGLTLEHQAAAAADQVLAGRPSNRAGDPPWCAAGPALRRGARQRSISARAGLVASDPGRGPADRARGCRQGGHGGRCPGPGSRPAPGRDRPRRRAPRRNRCRPVPGPAQAVAPSR